MLVDREVGVGIGDIETSQDRKLDHTLWISHSPL
jgi:hypothetical protein